MQRNSTPGSQLVDSYRDTWAIVLAGGDGRRLRSLTTTLGGIAVPKQYCSLWGGASLFDEALVRAATIAPMRQLCAVVAASHRRWWSTPMARYPSENVIVQPQNRGTGIGILLALLRVFRRDPDANVVFLPADHHLEDEAIMANALQQVSDFAVGDKETVYLLGAEASEPDAELGYIVPADSPRDRPAVVQRFVEKPSHADASVLLAQGALVNVFIVAASVRAFLALYRSGHADAVATLDAALRPVGGTPAQLSAAYEHLAPIDFSNDILAKHTPLLRVLTVPQCGWTDLGTPERVAEALKSEPRKEQAYSSQSGSVGSLNLATQWLSSR